MRPLITFLSLLISTVLFAQDADFPDYRSKRENFSKMQEKDVRADLAAFTLSGIDESIGKVPLKTVPVAALTNNSISFKGDGIEIHLEAGPFVQGKRKMAYYTNTENNNKYLVRIDGRPFYGNYGQLPNTEIRQFAVVINGDSVVIPPAAYSDIFNPTFSRKEDRSKTRNNVFLSNDGKKIYVYLINEEPGNRYEVTWVFQGKTYLRRVVDYGF